MQWWRSCQKGSTVQKQWHALYDSHCSKIPACPPRSNTVIFLFVGSRSSSVNALVSSWCGNIGTTSKAASVAWENRMRGKTKCFNFYKGGDRRGNFLRIMRLIRMEKYQWSIGLMSFHVQLVWLSGPKTFKHFKLAVLMSNTLNMRIRWAKLIQRSTKVIHIVLMWKYVIRLVPYLFLF